MNYNGTATDTNYHSHNLSSASASSNYDSHSHSGSTGTESSHSHSINIGNNLSHNHTVPAHQHGMSHMHEIELPGHTHEIIYGIFESTLATGVKIKVDGTERLNNGGTGYNADQSNLDITAWIQTAGWHTVELTSTQLGRINASLYMKSFVGV